MEVAEYDHRKQHDRHISQVVGKLVPEKNAFDLMRATFPAGTVSGAPKVRAMQIIAEQEKLRATHMQELWDILGSMEITIPALPYCDVDQWKNQLQAGAGIVADSVPENEFQETINKAKGMLKAIALAEQINLQSNQLELMQSAPEQSSPISTCNRYLKFLCLQLKRKLNWLPKLPRVMKKLGTIMITANLRLVVKIAQEYSNLGSLCSILSTRVTWG